MNTIKIKLSQIKLDLDNLRQHNKDEIDLLKKSLTIFGQFKPIIIDKNTMTVKIGNGRVMAMRELGWTECDCLLIDFSDKKGMEIIDNRLNELSSWQEKEVKKWWKEKGNTWWGIDKEVESKINKILNAESKEKRNKTEILCPKCGKPLQKKKRIILD